jgi:pimeloyl-ACP methyl ester carboxylesterase
MNIETFRVASSSGTDLACVRFGEGPPLLLAHPLVFSKLYFTAAAQVLGEKFSCVVYDQRGHGDTTATTISPAAMADDVGAVLAAMKWDKAAIGGTSLGAASTLLFALRAPARVTFLIQDLPGFGPASFRDPSKTSRIAASFEDADLEDAARQIGDGEPGRRRGPRRSSPLEELRRPGSRTSSRGLRNTSSWRIVGRWLDELQATCRSASSVSRAIRSIPGMRPRPWLAPSKSAAQPAGPVARRGRQCPPVDRRARLMKHIPVLLGEVFDALKPKKGHVVVDCTVGLGGHSAELLERGVRVIGLDLDPANLKEAKERFEVQGGEFSLHHANFAGLPTVLGELGLEGVDGSQPTWRLEPASTTRGGASPTGVRARSTCAGSDARQDAAEILDQMARRAGGVILELATEDAAKITG